LQRVIRSVCGFIFVVFFFSSRRRHTRFSRDWSSDVCSSDLHYLDFPRCVGQWWPPSDFSEGFVLWRGVGADYEGGVLDGASRIAIQMAHRLFAVVAAAMLWLLSCRAMRPPGLRAWAVVLALLTLAQVLLGVLNVKLSLPLPVAVRHTGGAALLLSTLVSLLARLRRPG